MAHAVWPPPRISGRSRCTQCDARNATHALHCVHFGGTSADRASLCQLLGWLFTRAANATACDQAPFTHSHALRLPAPQPLGRRIRVVLDGRLPALQSGGVRLVKDRHLVSTTE